MYRRRFPWFRLEQEAFRDALEWQAEVIPRPSGYFRWGLPRLVWTLRSLRPLLDSERSVGLLEIGCDSPFSLLMSRWLEARGLTIWKHARTSRDGLSRRYRTPAKDIEVVCKSCRLGTETLPFASGEFDLVFLTEALEHIDAHLEPIIGEINRVLKGGGHLLLTTPNAASWTTAYQASNGVFGFDSPTFGGELGHRYEYANCDVNHMLKRAGFSVRVRSCRDVYFRDPHGARQGVQFMGFLVSTVLTGDFASAGKLALRSGSTSFFLAQKERSWERPQELLPI